MGMDMLRLIPAIMSQPQAGVHPGRKAFSKGAAFDKTRSLLACGWYLCSQSRKMGRHKRAE